MCKNKLLIASFVVFCLITNWAVATKSDFELDLVQVLFRHGDRVPNEEEIYKNDPYNSKYYEPKGRSQLTKEGKNRALKIGQILRERYDDFLGEYDPEDVFAFSTKTDRTMMSLSLLLAGLYPPSLRTAWNDDVRWSPIPTFYEPDNRNFLFANVDDCVRLRDHLKAVEESSKTKKKLEKYKESLQYIKNLTDIDITRPFAIFRLHNNLRGALGMGLPLPYWCSNELFQVLKDVSNIHYETLVGTLDLKRMFVGPTIEKLLENMNSNKSRKKKIYLFSAHDLNIGTFTRAHNFTGIPDLPDFGSAIIVEKFVNHQLNESFVQMLYWTGVSEQLIPVKLEDCEAKCLLKSYSRKVESLLPTEEDRFCSISETCSSE